MNIEEDLPYIVAFSRFIGIGPMKYRSLLSGRSVEEAYHLSVNRLADVVGHQTARKFSAFRESFNPTQYMCELQERDILVVAHGSAGYPPQLAVLTDAPICLYIKGNPASLTRAEHRYVGIVGTRKSTAAGQRLTQLIVADLVERSSEIVIVSGLAYGVDATAHKACMEHGAQTVAFLGCGVDIPYPSGNRALYQEIIARGGAVVSEFPPGQTVAPGLFIARNRLISGLSKAVVVVEGSKQSGSLITARYAAEQGKDVFAVPGSPLIEHSEAPNILIHEGASIVVRVTDVGDALGLGSNHHQSPQHVVPMTQQEVALYRYLEQLPRRVDEIILQMQSPAVEVLHLLSQLELAGCVERGPDDRYGTKAWKRV